MTPALAAVLILAAALVVWHLADDRDGELEADRARARWERQRTTPQPATVWATDQGGRHAAGHTRDLTASAHRARHAVPGAAR